MFNFSKEVNQIQSKENVQRKDIPDDRNTSNKAVSDDGQSSVNEEGKNLPILKEETLNKSTVKVFVYLLTGTCPWFFFWDGRTLLVMG